MNQQILRKIKQMQQEMIDAQQEIEKTDFVASAGGVVTVTLKGNKQIQKVEIAKGFTIDGQEDVEMLSDMIVAACNQAYREIEKMTEDKLGKYQAMLPGMGNLF
jgi:DNA-binding YbaB/EbfC family protein